MKTAEEIKAGRIQERERVLRNIKRLERTMRFRRENMGKVCRDWRLELGVEQKADKLKLKMFHRLLCNLDAKLSGN